MNFLNFNPYIPVNLINIFKKYITQISCYPHIPIDRFTLCLKSSSAWQIVAIKKKENVNKNKNKSNSMWVYYQNAS